MSKLTASATSLHKGSRSVSASALPEASYSTMMLPAKDGRKKRIRSLSESNSSDGKIIVQRRSEPTDAAFSSSLDEESGLEELLPRIATNAFSLLPNSFEPIPDYSNNKSIQKGQRSISTPKIKLKPRPPRRSSASIRPRENGCRTMMPSSIKSPPPKIFIPFLPSRNRYSRYEQVVHPPPLIPQLPTNSHSTHSTPTTTDGSRFRQVWSDPLPLQILKKTKLTSSLSIPLSSPPQLIPSFDYGMSVSTTRDAITPPPISIRPPAPLTTPPSLMTSNTSLLMTSLETIHKNSRGEIVAPAAMVAKPIARRMFITPSNRHNTNPNTTNTNRTVDTFLSWDDDCTPRRVFPSSRSNNHNSDVGVASLSSSVESSAFSFSSAAPPSSLSTTTILRSTRIIRRPLRSEEDDGLLRGATSL